MARGSPVDRSAGFLAGALARRAGLAALVAAWLSVWSGSAAAQVASMTGKLLDDVTITQRPGAEVPLDLWFRDADDQPVQLRQLFRGRPVVLNLVYYRCPRLCKMTTAGLLRTLRAMELKVGQAFDILTISFDPREPASEAKAARRTALTLYEQPSAIEGWYFLVGQADAINALVESVGFRVAFDDDLDQYAHAAGLVILTPEGRVSRYLNGVEFAVRDLRLALVEASNNRIGSVTDQVLLLCYQYNPKIGKFSFAVHGLLKGLGISTVLILAASVVWMLRRERRESHEEPHPPDAAAAESADGNENPLPGEGTPST